MEAALWTLLTNAADIAALIDTRLYPLLIPQEQSLAAVAYQLISAPGQYTHDQGDIGLVRARVQLTAQGATYSELHALLGALRAAVSGYAGTVGTTHFQAIFIENERHVWAEAFKRPTGQVDLIIWYREVQDE